MGGILFITTFGLLLVQALGALYLGISTEKYAFSIVATIIFLLFAIGYLLRQLRRQKRAGIPAAIGFALGFIHIVYYSFFTGSLWLVILLCLDAAGFILALEHLTVMKRRRSASFDRRAFIERQLPPEPPAKVEVYSAKTKKKRGRPKKTAKKVVKKKRGRPKKVAKK